MDRHPLQHFATSVPPTPPPVSKRATLRCATAVAPTVSDPDVLQRHNTSGTVLDLVAQRMVVRMMQFRVSIPWIGYFQTDLEPGYEAEAYETDDPYDYDSEDSYDDEWDYVQDEELSRLGECADDPQNGGHIAEGVFLRGGSKLGNTGPNQGEASGHRTDQVQ